MQEAREQWDAVVIGAGHNGLTCAYYLAKAGNGRKRVLVLERRPVIGGACSLKRWKTPKGEIVISPCAYLAGLLHPLIVEELGLEKRGLKVTPADAGLFVPFEDGESILFHDDDEKCLEEIKRINPADAANWKNMKEFVTSVRDAIRPADSNFDFWNAKIAPTQEEIRKRLEEKLVVKEGVWNVDTAMAFLFEWSMIEFVDYFLQNERIKLALLGQGVIGTRASPFEKGTAYIYFHHACGRMMGIPGGWSYVHGGMGKISDFICEAAVEAGVVVRTNAEVKTIHPGEGVTLVSGQKIRAPIIVSNADPVTTLRLIEPNKVDRQWKERVEAIPMIGSSLKVNIAMTELPNFKTRPGVSELHHLAQVDIPLSKEEWKDCLDKVRRGELPSKIFCELYFQTAVDKSVALGTGLHHVSVFAQSVPFKFADSSPTDETWSERHRKEVERVVLESLSRHISNIPSAVVAVEVFGPPDIQKDIGLHGGHIFQGECLPDNMWSKRIPSKTPMEGLFLCGSAIHPGGSVIAINGRNAALSVLDHMSTIEKAKL